MGGGEVDDLDSSSFNLLADVMVTGVNMSGSAGDLRGFGEVDSRVVVLLYSGGEGLGETDVVHEVAECFHFLADLSECNILGLHAASRYTGFLGS